MIALRLLRVALHILSGLLVCALVFPRVSPAARQERIGMWSARLLQLFRITVEVVDGATGTLLGTGVLQGASNSVVVANHVSWLDIFVINTMQPCRFVAKSDIRDWPVLGYLCAQSATIFISRGSPRDVRKTFKSLVASIEAGERVAFFPEGTTAAQGTLLPFHANLFEAAIDAGVPIQPLALRYLDPQGRLDSGVDYIGDTTFMESMLTILRGPAIRARIMLLPAIASGAGDDMTGDAGHGGGKGGRRALAQATHAEIAAALGYLKEDAGA